MVNMNNSDGPKTPRPTPSQRSPQGCKVAAPADIVTIDFIDRAKDSKEGDQYSRLSVGEEQNVKRIYVVEYRDGLRRYCVEFDKPQIVGSTETILYLHPDDIRTTVEARAVL